MGYAYRGRILEEAGGEIVAARSRAKLRAAERRRGPVISHETFDAMDIGAGGQIQSVADEELSLRVRLPLSGGSTRLLLHQFCEPLPTHPVMKLLAVGGPPIDAAFADEQPPSDRFIGVDHYLGVAVDDRALGKMQIEGVFRHLASVEVAFASTKPLDVAE